MKVLFDDRWLGTTGIGRYASEILDRTPPGVDVVLLREKYPIKDTLTPLRLARSIHRIKPDIFYSPGFIPPISLKVPYVFTIHDLQQLHFGNYLHRIYYDFAIKPLAKRAAFVLTDSQYSKNEILKWSGLPETKVVSIPLGIAPEFCEQGPAYSLDKRYVLYVGNRRAIKNIPRLIQSFALANLDKDIVLAITGNYDADLYSLAKDAGIEGRLVFLGLVPEAEIPNLYRSAIALVHISLLEGFGLPPLEAMACGTPVVTSNTTSLPEVAGDACLLVDPLNVEEIACAIAKIVKSPELQAQHRRLGFIQARKFSWDRCAASIWHRISLAAAIEASRVEAR